MKMNKKASVIATSVAAIALSSSLIAGSTYALFTSESKVNIAVTSGKVQVTAQIGDVVTKSMGVETENNTFENGGFVTVNDNKIVLSDISAGDEVVIPVSISNESTINVLYNTEVTVIGELADELVVTVDDGIAYEGATSYTSAWALLEKGAQTDAVTYITVSLPESAEGQGLGASIDLKVNAVQANAGYKAGEGKLVKCGDTILASSENELYSMFNIGGDIKLVGDVKLSSNNINAYTQDATLDLNGYTLSAEGREGDSGWAVIAATDGATLTINGEGTVNSLGMTWPIAVEACDGGTVIINGGTYIGGDGNAALYANGHNTPGLDTYIIVNGGYFKTGTYKNDHCVINIRDNEYSHAIVYGGTFEDYNPAWGDQTMNKDIYGKDYDDKGNFVSEGGFVAAGYHVELEEKDGHRLYTVVENRDTTILVSSTEDIMQVMSTGKGGKIKLQGNIDLGGGDVDANGAVNPTIIAPGKYEIDLNGYELQLGHVMSIGGAELYIKNGSMVCNESTKTSETPLSALVMMTFYGDITATFDNVIFNVAKDNPEGYNAGANIAVEAGAVGNYTCNLIFNDCDIKGILHFSGTTVTMNNCTVDSSEWTKTPTFRLMNNAELILNGGSVITGVSDTNTYPNGYFYDVSSGTYTDMSASVTNNDCELK